MFAKNTLHLLMAYSYYLFVNFIGGLEMKKEKDAPEIRREKMRQEELKHPSSSMHGSNLADLVGGLGWKGTGILILIIIVGVIIYAAFFQ